MTVIYYLVFGAVFAGLCLVFFGRNAPWMKRTRPVLFALPVIYLLYVYHTHAG